MWCGSTPASVSSRRFYAYEAPRTDLRGRGFLGFGKVRVWDPDRGRETTTTYDHETRDRQVYPYALLPKEVLEVTPILEQAAPGEPFRQAGRAPARIFRRVNVYQTKWLHRERTYFVHPESWTSWEWEQDVDIDWDQEKIEHIRAPKDPPARVLRKRHGSFRFDDYGNVLEERVATEGGVERTIASTYDIREAAWLVGLLQRREVTEGQSRRVVRVPDDDRGLLAQVRIEPDHPDPDIPETIAITRSPDDGLVSAVMRQAAGQAPRTASIDYDGERVFPRPRVERPEARHRLRLSSRLWHARHRDGRQRGTHPAHP